MNRRQQRDCPCTLAIAAAPYQNRGFSHQLKLLFQSLWRRRRKSHPTWPQLQVILVRWTRRWTRTCSRHCPRFFKVKDRRTTTAIRTAKTGIPRTGHQQCLPGTTKLRTLDSFPRLDRAKVSQRVAISLLPSATLLIQHHILSIAANTLPSRSTRSRTMRRTMTRILTPEASMRKRRMIVRRGRPVDCTILTLRTRVSSVSRRETLCGSTIDSSQAGSWGRRRASLVLSLKTMYNYFSIVGDDCLVQLSLRATKKWTRETSLLVKAYKRLLYIKYK